MLKNKGVSLNVLLLTKRSLHRAYLVGGSVQSISQILTHNLMKWTSITVKSPPYK